MKALVRKDFYVVVKQMKFFILFIVVFSLLPSMSTNLFAIVYAAMLPYTAMAYDERSHWDQLAAMMPYSIRDIVLSKYVLGWAFVGISVLFTLAAQLVTMPFTHYPPAPLDTLTAFCTGVIVMAITLPLMFRFGVEKGRVVFIFGVVGLAVAGTTFVSISTGPDSLALPTGLLPVLLIAAAVLSAVSILLSMRFRQTRQA